MNIKYLNYYILESILIYLNNEDKVNSLSTTKKLNEFKNKVYFDEEINIEKIKKLTYFNQFRNIHTDYLDNFPLNMTHLTLGSRFN